LDERRPNVKEYEERILLDAVDVVSVVGNSKRQPVRHWSADPSRRRPRPPPRPPWNYPSLDGISVARFRIPPFVSFEDPAVAVTLRTGVSRGRRPGLDRTPATRAGPPPIYWTYLLRPRESIYIM